MNLRNLKDIIMIHIRDDNIGCFIILKTTQNTKEI